MSNNVNDPKGNLGNVIGDVTGLSRDPVLLCWFDNMAEIFDWVMNTPIKERHGFCSSDSRDQDNWYLSSSLRHYRDWWANGGWPEAAEISQRISSSIKDVIVAASEGAQQVWTDAPADYADMGRALEGLPEFNSMTLPFEGQRAVHIGVNACVMSCVDCDQILVRAIAASALVDSLEALGYRCAVSVWIITQPSGRLPEDKIIAGMKEPKRLGMATLVKAHSAPLNVSDLVMAVGHPAMQRRLGFAVRERVPGVMTWVGNGYGRSVDRTIHDKVPQDPMPLDIMIPAVPDEFSEHSIRTYLRKVFDSAEGRIELSEALDRVINDVAKRIYDEVPDLIKNAEKRSKKWKETGINDPRIGYGATA